MQDGWILERQLMETKFESKYKQNAFKIEEEEKEDRVRKEKKKSGNGRKGGGWIDYHGTEGPVSYL